MKLKGHFWYSKKMEDVERNCLSLPRKYALIRNKIVQYTEMRQGLLSIIPISNWDDLEYLGYGKFHHLERE